MTLKEESDQHWIYVLESFHFAHLTSDPHIFVLFTSMLEILPHTLVGAYTYVQFKIFPHYFKMLDTNLQTLEDSAYKIFCKHLTTFLAAFLSDTCSSLLKWEYYIVTNLNCSFLFIEMISLK